MPEISKRNLAIAQPSFAIASLLVMSAATAYGSPVVNFDITVLGGLGGPFHDNFNQNGVFTGNPGVYHYQESGPGSPWPFGVDDGSGSFRILWNFNADGDPTGTGPSNGAKIGANFTVYNNLPELPDPAANHMQFSLIVTMAVQPTPMNTTFLGSGGHVFTITQRANDLGQWGFLTALNGPMWNYRIDGNDVASLYPTGYQLGGSGPGTISDSRSLSAAQTAPLADMHPGTMSIRLDFDLTPGESVAFNGIFGMLIIPEPGALALLGLAGLLSRGRRRRA
jgi:hypothetical protein